MSEADSFLWAILDNPDDDGPRLVFADWLDEHGESAHAEFIRVQCALAAHPDEDDQWLAWKVREEELWGALRERWQGALDELKLTRLGLNDFRRGFVHTPQGVFPEADVFARAAGRWTFLLGCGVTIGGCATAEFFASAQMRRVEDLDCQRSGVTDEKLQPVATSPHYGRVASFDLFRNYVGPAGIEALVRCPSLTALAELTLEENRVGDAGAEMLAAAPLCRNLTRLHLNENGIGDAGVIALARSPHLANLRVLRLSSNRFGPAGVETLAASPYLTRLQELTIIGASDAYAENIDALLALTERLGAGFDAYTLEEEAP
jgi:uncharacterized protein (TIGR02996 family)